VTAVYKYGNETWGRIKENFCRLPEQLNFLCHGIIVKTFICIASIEKKSWTEAVQSFCCAFKLNSFCLTHCDVITFCVGSIHY
jgi:hypothetical protein